MLQQVVVLSLLVTAVLVSCNEPNQGCYIDDETYLTPGQKVTGPNCSQYTCHENGSLTALACPLSFGYNRTVVVGDTTKPFPECCPKLIDCDNPEPAKGCNLDDGTFLEPGQHAPGPNCTQYTCQNDGSVAALACPLAIGNNCETVEDKSQLYPGCCPQLVNCDDPEPAKGCNLDDGTFLEPGQHAPGLNCTQYTCQNDGSVAALACPLAIGYNCETVEDKSQLYPGCCPQLVNCDDPEPATGCNLDDGTFLEPGQHAPGPNCTQYTCQNDGSVAALACPLAIGNNCETVEDKSQSYPGCCPQLVNCDDPEPAKGCNLDDGTFLEPGQHAPGPNCTQYTCQNDGSVAALACPLAIGNNCETVEDKSQSYPGCCPQLVNCDDPEPAKGCNLDDGTFLELGQHAPGPNCTQYTCQDDGSLAALACPLAIGYNCETVEDKSQSYPGCCPQLVNCDDPEPAKGCNLDDGTFLELGQHAPGPNCTQYTCQNDGSVAALACPLAIGNNCETVEDKSQSYPGCCPQLVNCDDPEPAKGCNLDDGTFLELGQHAPGPNCTQYTCQDDGSLAALACPLAIGYNCETVEDKSQSYPGCCPQLVNCDDPEPAKGCNLDDGTFLEPGQHAPGPNCTQYTCQNDGSVAALACPLAIGNNCETVEDKSQSYPGCCPQLVNCDDPEPAKGCNLDDGTFLEPGQHAPGPNCTQYTCQDDGSLAALACPLAIGYNCETVEDKSQSYPGCCPQLVNCDDPEPAKGCNLDDGTFLEPGQHAPGPNCTQYTCQNDGSVAALACPLAIGNNCETVEDKSQSYPGCCPQLVNCDDPEPAKGCNLDDGTFLEPGQHAPGPNCTQYTCQNDGSLAALACPLAIGYNCETIEDKSQSYPGCCPQLVNCDDPEPAKGCNLDDGTFLELGQHAPGPNCTQYTCQDDGSLAALACPLAIGNNCETIDDKSQLYPGCCPQLINCDDTEPAQGCNLDDGTFLEPGQHAPGPNCTQYTCQDDGALAVLGCPLEIGNNYEIVEDASKPYPKCCPTLMDCEELK